MALNEEEFWEVFRAELTATVEDLSRLKASIGAADKNLPAAVLAALREPSRRRSRISGR